jgi:predicted ArsR family transcriptional regulator
MLRQMVQPATCPQLAEALGITMQKAYYHVKVLEKAGLVRKLGTRQARGIQEGIYQAVAQNYLLSPRLTESLGGVGKAREHVSLGLIQSMAEDLTQDIERLSRRRDRVAAAGVSARIELDPSQRAAFIAELQEMVQGLARKYGDAGNAWDTQSFKLLLACYEEPSVEREEL